MASNNVHSLGGTITLKEEYQGAVQSCRQILLKTLPRLMDGLFEQLDDVLYRKADGAQTNHQQTTYFDAMRELRLSHEAIEDGFNVALIKRYDNFWREGPTLNLAEEPVYALTDGAQDAFSLVEDSDLEETLALNNLIAKGDSLFTRELYALDQRFGHMLNGIKVDDGGNPVSPTALGYCFRDSLAQLELDMTVRLIVYKQFEQHVIAQLGEMYELMNKVLAGFGIVAQLSARRSPSRPSQRAPAAPSSDPSESFVDGVGVPEMPLMPGTDDQAQFFSMLQSLLNVRRSGFRRPPQSLRLPVFRTEQVLSALTSLQHQQSTMSAQGGQAVLYDIRTGLETNLKAIEAANQEHRIDEVDEDAIDLISMLFEFILHDENLHEAMKAQLACLQIPMLKVAIIDKRFFNDEGHPARQLLNSMAQAAIGWSEPDGRHPGGLYDRIAGIVQAVVTQFENDIGLFERLGKEFSSFLESEQKSARIAESRAAQVTKGKEQLNRAKQDVLQALDQRLDMNRHIPTLVSDFLREGWKDVLLLIALQKGTDTAEWRDTLSLADDLIWSVKPKTEQDERQRLLKLIPGLLKGLRQGLNDISYNQHQMNSLFKKLQAYHVRCLRGIEPEHQQPAQQAQDQGGEVWRQVNDELRDMRDTRDPDAAAEGIDDEYEQLAGSINIGRWLEMTQDGGDVMRVKLSWRSGVTGDCLFVNRKGLKAAELTLQGLARQLQEGRMRLLDDEGKPLVDRALNAVISELSGNLGKDH